MLFLSGCKSYWIDATIENRTGAAVDLVEVDYPSASFGIDHLDAGATSHYRFQTRGSGPIQIAYTAPDHSQLHATGPVLREREMGRITIDLLPGGKTNFDPALESK